MVLAELLSSRLVIPLAARAGILPWFIKKEREFVCGVGFLAVTRLDKKCKIEQKWAEKSRLVLIYVELYAGDGQIPVGCSSGIPVTLNPDFNAERSRTVQSFTM